MYCNRWNIRKKKLEALNITNIFPKNRVFVSDMVKNGKPEPDLFLLAAKQMKELPDDCVIIEDSIAGLTAAIKAKIDVVAYIGSNINNNKEYEDKVKKLGIKHIYNNMNDIYHFIFNEKKLL